MRSKACSASISDLGRLSESPNKYDNGNDWSDQVRRRRLTGKYPKAEKYESRQGSENPQCCNPAEISWKHHQSFAMGVEPNMGDIWICKGGPVYQRNDRPGRFEPIDRYWRQCRYWNVKRATPKVARFHLFNCLRPQSPANNIHHITPVTQRDRQHFA
jgi:hypothetical protein